MAPFQILIIMIDTFMSKEHFNFYVWAHILLMYQLLFNQGVLYDTSSLTTAVK